MPVFLIIALEHPRRLGRLIARAIPDPGNRYTLPNYTGFYVWFNGTTLDLAKLLDLPGTATPDNSPSPAVIQMVSAYGGYAPDELWSWLRFNVKREPDPEEEKRAPEAADEAGEDPENTEKAAKAILEAPMPAPRKRKRRRKKAEAPGEEAQSDGKPLGAEAPAAPSDAAPEESKASIRQHRRRGTKRKTPKAEA